MDYYSNAGERHVFGSPSPRARGTSSFWEAPLTQALSPVWTLGAWCELRQDFRNFRLDRIEEVTILDDAFTYEPPTTLEDYIQAMTEDER